MKGGHVEHLNVSEKFWSDQKDIQAMVEGNQGATHKPIFAWIISTKVV